MTLRSNLEHEFLRNGFTWDEVQKMVEELLHDLGEAKRENDLDDSPVLPMPSEIAYELPRVSDAHIERVF